MSETVYGEEDGWVEGVGREMSLFQKKDNHCLEKKKTSRFRFRYICSLLRLKIFLCFCFMFIFSDLVIFSFDNHSWVDFFSQGE